MKITALKLYKVPFDYSYKNVFDFADYDESVSNFYGFIEQFPNEQVTFTGERSVNSIDRNFSVTILKDYDSILEYNYCAITSNSKIKYYFITSIGSVNDSSTNGTCAINLEFDVWHNYLPELHNVNNFDENYVVKCHQDRFIKNPLTQNLTRVFSSTKEDFEDNLNHRQKLSSKKKNVLWLSIRLDSDVYIKDYILYSTPTPIKIVSGLVSSQANSPIVYIPVAAINDDGEECERVQYYQNGEQIFDSFLDIESIFERLDDTHILSAVLTYFVPFDYSTSFGFYQTGNSLIITLPNYTIEPASGLICSQIYSDISASNAILNYSICDFRNEIQYTREEFLISGYNSSDIINGTQEYSDITNTSARHNIISESKFYTYPYNYMSLKIRDFSKVIENTNLYNSIKLYVDAKNKTNLLVTIEENGQYNDKGLFISNPSQCITKISNYDLFLRNSGESAYTGLFTKLISNTIKGMAGNFAASFTNLPPIGKEIPGMLGQTNNASDLFSFSAKVRDLKNQQDNYAIPDFIAQNDLFYQDNVFVYENELYVTEEINNIKLNFMRYGYNLFSNKSIRVNSRFWFDYVRTQNCSLNFIKNIKDRKLLEAIYNSGITKWHIHKIQSSFQAKTNFDFTVNNPELTIASGYSSRLATPANLQISLSHTLTCNPVYGAENYHLMDYDTAFIYAISPTPEFELDDIFSEDGTYNLCIFCSGTGFVTSNQSLTIQYILAQVKLPTPISFFFYNNIFSILTGYPIGTTLHIVNASTLVEITSILDNYQIDMTQYLSLGSNYVKVYATNTDYLDSELSETQELVKTVPLSAPTISISGNMLTIPNVYGAQTYAVYEYNEGGTDVLIDTITEAEREISGGIEEMQQYYIGNQEKYFYVIAKSPLFTDSEKSNIVEWTYNIFTITYIRANCNHVIPQGETLPTTIATGEYKVLFFEPVSSDYLWNRYEEDFGIQKVINATYIFSPMTGQLTISNVTGNVTILMTAHYRFKNVFYSLQNCIVQCAFSATYLINNPPTSRFTIELVPDTTVYELQIKFYDSNNSLLKTMRETESYPTNRYKFIANSGYVIDDTSVSFTGVGNYLNLSYSTSNDTYTINLGTPEPPPSDTTADNKYKIYRYLYSNNLLISGSAVPV